MTYDQTALYSEASRALGGASAHIILEGTRIVAKITIKYSKSNLRCTAYLWIAGGGISKGYAGGGGYDRQSAALAKAARAMPPCEYRGIVGYQERYDAIIGALLNDNGERWHERLYKSGYSTIDAL